MFSFGIFPIEYISCKLLVINITELSSKLLYRGRTKRWAELYERISFPYASHKRRLESNLFAIWTTLPSILISPRLQRSIHYVFIKMWVEVLVAESATICGFWDLRSWEGTVGTSAALLTSRTLFTAGRIFCSDEMFMTKYHWFLYEKKQEPDYYNNSNHSHFTPDRLYWNQIF